MMKPPKTKILGPKPLVIVRASALLTWGLVMFGHGSDITALDTLSTVLVTFYLVIGYFFTIVSGALLLYGGSGVKELMATGTYKHLDSEELDAMVLWHEQMAHEQRRGAKMWSYLIITLWFSGLILVGWTIPAIFYVPMAVGVIFLHTRTNHIFGQLTTLVNFHKPL